MKPAERIPLLKKLATALADIDDWREIDLTLRQFGFSTDDEFGGNDLYGYALYQLEGSGSDEALVELERYLDPAAAGGAMRPVSEAPGPWKGDSTFRLFISHTQPQAAFAGEMRSFLGRFLVEAFVAHEDIEPSEKWQEVMESALLTCHAAVAVVTQDFRESAWCDQEMGFCIARSICIVPLLFGLDPHGFLGGFQGVKLQPYANPRSGAWEAGTKVFEILAARPDTRERMVPCVVRRYSASYSYDNTRAAFTQLRRLPKDAWTPQLVQEAEEAPGANSQVRDAFLRTGTPVPEATKKLLAPIKKRLTPAPTLDDDIPF
jgi:TIR domain